MAPSNGTLQWHPAMATRPLHPAMAPSKLAVTRLAHYTGTLQWHHPSTLQWHPAMAPSNGTTPTPPKLVATLPLNHSTLQWHPTMAPSNGTTSTAPCNGTLVPRPIRQSGSSPSPLLEVRTPIAIAIWGTIAETMGLMADASSKTGFPHTLWPPAKCTPPRRPVLLDVMWSAPQPLSHSGHNVFESFALRKNSGLRVQVSSHSS